MKNKKNTPSQKSMAGKVADKTKKHCRELAAIKRKQVEASARRKVADEWHRVEGGRAYQKAAVREACCNTTINLISELYDGIILELNERNNNKSYGVRKRLIRRIVEKRQAQSAHQRIKRSDDGLTRHLHRRSIHCSMRQLQSHQSKLERVLYLPHLTKWFQIPHKTEPMMFE